MDSDVLNFTDGLNNATVCIQERNIGNFYYIPMSIAFSLSSNILNSVFSIHEMKLFSYHLPLLYFCYSFQE